LNGRLVAVGVTGARVGLNGTRVAVGATGYDTGVAVGIKGGLIALSVAGFSASNSLYHFPHINSFQNAI
jgi:hypothetical protein